MLESLKRNMLDIENIQLKDNSINDDIDYIKSKNAIMTPFLNNDININWYRISPYDLTNLSPNSWRYCNNPFVFTCYKKYKHLMLGIDKTKEETYLLAVPCRYNEEFKLRDFKEFLPVDNNVSAKSINNGEYGYRIVEL